MVFLPRTIFRICLLVAVMVGLGPRDLLAQATSGVTFTFTTGEQVSKDGYLRLAWLPDTTLADGRFWDYELQVDSLAGFGQPQLVYAGSDLATFVSGLPNGTYHYRIRAKHPDTGAEGPWSKVFVLTVDHHSLTLALSLAALGSVVFLVTVVVVLMGARKEG